MRKYTITSLKEDMKRLKLVGRTPMGFRPPGTAEDEERRKIRKRLHANGFEVEVQTRVWVSIDEEGDD